MRSGNDAATRAGRGRRGGDIDAFVQQMQATAADLGLDGAVIADSHGPGRRQPAVRPATWPRSPGSRSPTSGSARSAGQDVVDLPDIGAQENRNLLIGTFPGATGLKTGFTDLAGYCLVASARRDGRELVAVVLGRARGPGPLRGGRGAAGPRLRALRQPGPARPGGSPPRRLDGPAARRRGSGCRPLPRPSVALTGDEDQLVLRAGTEDADPRGPPRRSSRPPRSARWAGRWRRRCTPACGGPTCRSAWPAATSVGTTGPGSG